MERMASQVRNYYSNKHQESHIEGALVCTLKKTANCHSESNDSTSNSVKSSGGHSTTISQTQKLNYAHIA
jgi:hypothetical protein